MTAPVVRQLLLLLGIVITLTVLFFKTQTIDQDKHDQFLDNLRRIKHVDATLNEEVLKARTTLFTSYDSLVSVATRLQGITRELDQNVFAIDENAVSDIRQQLNKYADLQAERLRMVERFKSTNSLLRNSLRYLPVVTESIVGERGAT